MKKQKMVTLEISEELHKKLCTIQLMQKELHGKREQLRKILERLIITEMIFSIMSIYNIGIHRND